MPCIDKLLDEAKISLNQIDAFSCVTGPGSFTGIRVGITTIRAFAYVTEKPCIPISYFDVLRQTSNNSENVICLIDAGNNMKYLAVFDYNGNILLEPKYVDLNTLKLFINEVEEPYTIFSDTELNGYKVILRPMDGSDLIKTFEYARKDKTREINYKKLIPLYVAKSQAERDKGL